MRDRDSRLETAHERNDVSPVALAVQVEWNKKIDLRAGGKHRAKVKARRQHSHHRYRCSIQLDGLADDRRIGVELMAPVRVRQQRNGSSARLVGGEQTAHRRLHAKHLKEVADHFDSRGGLRLALAGKTEIVRVVNASYPVTS